MAGAGTAVGAVGVWVGGVLRPPAGAARAAGAGIRTAQENAEWHAQWTDAPTRTLGTRPPDTRRPPDRGIFDDPIDRAAEQKREIDERAAAAEIRRQREAEFALNREMLEEMDKADAERKAHKRETARTAAKALKKKEEAAKAAAARVEQDKRKELASKLLSDPKLAFLGAARPDDLIVIVNVASSPHAAVDLSGHLTFAGGIDVSCSSGVSMSRDEANLYEAGLAGLGVDSSKVQHARCDKMLGLDKVDTLLMRRSDLNKAGSDDVARLIAGLDSDAYIKGLVITADDLKAAANARAEALAALRSEIMAGNAKGYGVISTANGGTMLCNTTGLDKIPTMPRDATSVDFDPSKLQAASLDTNAAFISMKKHGCRAVIGDAASLRALMAGLDRDHVKYTLDSHWMADSAVSAHEPASPLEEKKPVDGAVSVHEPAPPAKEEMPVQEAQPRPTMKPEEHRDLDKGSRVAALKEAYVRETEELMRAPKQGKSLSDTKLAQLHPEIAMWYGERLKEGWKYVSSTVKVVDYGRTTWKGRDLEAVVLMSTIKIEGHGTTESVCYIGAHMYDTELSTAKHPWFGLCSDKIGLEHWETMIGFKTNVTHSALN